MTHKPLDTTYFALKGFEGHSGRTEENISGEYMFKKIHKAFVAFTLTIFTFFTFSTIRAEIYEPEEEIESIVTQIKNIHSKMLKFKNRSWSCDTWLEFFIMILKLKFEEDKTKNRMNALRKAIAPKLA